MANELTINASVAYEDSAGATDSLSLTDLLVTMATKVFAHVKVSVGTSEQALALNSIAALGFILIINRDDTNFVNIKTGTGGTVIVKLKAGECALFRFGSGVTAPYLQADTAACVVEYILFSN